MNTIILSYAARLLFPVLLVLSLIILYRGHNLPGGGFIGGLVAASAYILVGLGEGMAKARARMPASPRMIMAIGLAIAALSGIPALFSGAPYLTGEWLPDFTLPLLGTMHLGTPLIFDVGVFCAVVGFTLQTAFSLAEVNDS